MIHTAHPELIARPFANWPAAMPLPQDAIRERMLSDMRPAPVVLRKGTNTPPPAKMGNDAQKAKRAAERAALMPEVVRMRNHGMIQSEIAAALKISRDRVRAIMSEAGI